MLISLSDLIKKLAAEIPQEWKQWKQERPVEAPPEELIKDKVHQIKNQIGDKTITNLRPFLKYLNRSLTYIKNEIRDPAKHGLSQDLSELTNEIPSKIQKDKPLDLSSEKQKDIIDKAGKLHDTGKLLTLLSNLFKEHYPEEKEEEEFLLRKRQRRSSLTGILHEIVSRLL